MTMTILYTYVNQIPSSSIKISCVFFVLLWKMIMKIYYIDSSLHEEMLSIKGVLRHLETEHNVKLERLLVTHLPMVTGDYHTSAYFYRVSTKQAIYRTTDSSHGTDYGVCWVPDTLYLLESSGSEGKASAFNAGDLGFIFGWGRPPGEGNGNPLQYSCLENAMDGEAW